MKAINANQQHVVLRSLLPTHNLICLRGSVAIESIKKHKSVYLMVVGGAAYLVSKAIVNKDMRLSIVGCQSFELATGDSDMNAKAMSLNEIRRTGIQLLTQNLGAVGMVRFLQQSEMGWGDYTKEREQWLGNPSLSEIAVGIKNMKRPNETN